MQAAPWPFCVLPGEIKCIKVESLYMYQHWIRLGYCGRKHYVSLIEESMEDLLKFRDCREKPGQNVRSFYFIHYFALPI